MSGNRSTMTGNVYAAAIQDAYTTLMGQAGGIAGQSSQSSQVTMAPSLHPIPSNPHHAFMYGVVAAALGSVARLNGVYFMGNSDIFRHTEYVAVSVTLKDGGRRIMEIELPNQGGLNGEYADELRARFQMELS